MAKDKKHSEEQKSVRLNVTPDKLIPKYATNVFFQVASDKLLMTFSFKDPQEESVETIIERIIVDLDHAQKISEVLQNVLKGENDEK